MKTIFSFNKSKQFIILLCVFSSFIFSQTAATGSVKNRSIDSLLKAVSKGKEDTVQVMTIMRLAREYKNTGEIELLMKYSKQLLSLSEKLKSQKGITEAYNFIGGVHKLQGHFELALECYLKILKIKEELGDKRGIASANNNIGNLYYALKNLTRSIEYHEKALKVREEIGDKIGIGTSLNNLGLINNKNGDYEKALSYLEKAMAIWVELKDENHIGDSYNNLGLVIEKLGDEAGQKNNPSKAELNYKRAIEYHLKALSAKEKLGDKQGIANANGNLANIYVKQKRYTEAEQRYAVCMKIFEEGKQLENQLEVLTNLALLFYDKGDFKTSCNYEVKYAKLKDTLYNKESAKQVSEMNAKYETEKKDKELLKKDAEISRQEAQSARQQAQRNIFIVGFGLALILALFILRGYRAKQKANRIITKQKDEVERQKHLVEEQKEIVEEKQKEIIDSISYAKRLQEAILPSEKEIFENLPESFLLYLPKDIVAGDFYWMERVGDSVLIAAADSTGHGVPGAMVSVVCSNALHRAVVEFGIVEPGKILDKVREMVVQTFAKSDQDVKDGMDISLASINLKTREVKWAGANNPLWYLKQNEIHEIVANKQPIGKTDNPTEFETHSVQLAKDDMLFLFTDGYADQFGGPQGKKFKYKPFKEMLLRISKEGAVRQKQLLQQLFIEWKGSMEQVDDVCIIGLRM